MKPSACQRVRTRGSRLRRVPHGCAVRPGAQEHLLLDLQAFGRHDVLDTTQDVVEQNGEKRSRQRAE